MKYEIKLKRAIQESKSYFKKLSKRYGTNVAKKALYRVARNQSRKEKLAGEKEQLEKELERIERELKP